MLRCATLVVGALAFVATATDAQVSPLARPFPATALRGEIVVTQPPEVLLNGRAARLSPGSRIRGENNLLQISGALVNQRLVVNYTVDTHGLVQDVWVLTAEERARWPWPTTAAQASAWNYDAATQTWSKP
jgi:hypothetical protein